jgi:hypothetical protein
MTVGKVVVEYIKRHQEENNVYIQRWRCNEWLKKEDQKDKKVDKDR